jgi:hypothetical protein
MGRDAEMEVRIEKRTVSDAWNSDEPSKVDLWIVLVNGRRVDSFLKRRNAEAKAAKLKGLWKYDPTFR